MPSQIRYAAGVLAALTLVGALAACGGDHKSAERHPPAGTSAPTGPSPYHRLWSGAAGGTPVGSDLVETAGHSVVVRAIATGRLLWRADRVRWHGATYDLVTDGATVVGSSLVVDAISRGRAADEDVVVTMSLRDGGIRSVGPVGDRGRLVAVLGTTELWQTTEKDPAAETLTAVSARNDRVVWRHRGVGFEALDGTHAVVLSGPEVGNEGIRRPQVLDLVTGKTVWSAPGPADIDGVAGGWVDLTASSGAERAYVIADGRSVAAPSAAIDSGVSGMSGDGLVWEVDYDDFYVLSSDDAKPVEVHTAGGAAGASWQYVGGHLLVTAGGKVRTYDLKGRQTAPPLDGRLLWATDRFLAVEGAAATVYRIG